MRIVVLAALVACGDNREAQDAGPSGDGTVDDASDAGVDAPGPYCGDGTVDSDEECDDGLRGLSGDGCSSTCRAESLVFRTQESSPGVVAHYAIGFDPTRDRIVMFGGVRYGAGPSVAVDETWEWDGASWTQVITTVRPPPRVGATLFHDGERLVLVGDGTPWTWDGTSWTPIVSSSYPDGFHVSAAYDRVRGVHVIASDYQTWLWDGSTFLETGARGVDALVARTDGTILGYDIIEGFQIWNGASWSAADIPRFPSPPEFGAVLGLGYDAATNQPVGYSTIEASPRFAVWNLVGGTWVEATPTGDAPNSFYSRQYTFDGSGALTIFATDLWTWTGSSWTRHHSSPILPRSLGVLAWDALAGRVLLFGGGGSSVYYNDTWTYRDGIWSELPLTPRPSARIFASYAWDERRDRLVVHGGRVDPTRSPTWPVCTDDVWEFDGTTWHERIGGALVEQFGAGAYDRARGYTLFVRDRVTRTWDGTTLTIVDEDTPESFSLAHDARRGVTVLSGNDGALYEWDGGDWVPRSMQTTGFLFYDPVRARMIIQAGLDTLWEWDGTTATLLGNHPTGYVENVVYDRRARAWFSFGGATGYDSWTARWESSEVDERCDGSDADLDGLVRCADPDCWWRCTPRCPPYTTCSPADPHCGDGTCSQLEDTALCPADCQ